MPYVQDLSLPELFEGSTDADLLRLKPRQEEWRQVGLLLAVQVHEALDGMRSKLISLSI